MYGSSAPIYDAIYAAQGKDYRGESERLAAIVDSRAERPVRRILDVACGSGGHIEYLKSSREVEGIDVSADMLELARARHPEIRFHEADMSEFRLEPAFDAVLCLFSSIGYARSVDRMTETIQNLANHTTPGGVVVIEPWLTPDKWQDGRIDATFVDEPTLKVARIVRPERRDRICVFDFHFIVGDPSGVKHFIERHELMMFTHEEYIGALERVGLQPAHLAYGLTERGLYIGVKPAQDPV